MDRGSTTINFAVTAGAFTLSVILSMGDISYAPFITWAARSTKLLATMGTQNAEIPVTDKQVHEVYGSWSQHVLSWTRKPHQAIYVMRYEDMLAKAEKTFGALARHLLFDPTPAQLADAIDRSSFDKLRSQEEQEGFVERPERVERFFREGRADQWKEILTPRQVDRIVKDHSEQMARFDYLPD